MSGGGAGNRGANDQQFLPRHRKTVVHSISSLFPAQWSSALGLTQRVCLPRPFLLSILEAAAALEADPTRIQALLPPGATFIKGPILAGYSAAQQASSAQSKHGSCCVEPTVRQEERPGSSHPLG